MRRNRRDPEVFLVTQVGPSRREDIRARQRSYLIKMAIRTAALIAAIVLYAVGVPLPYLLILIVASTILPWMSVVVANAANPPPPTRGPEPPNALGPGSDPRP